MNTRPTTNRAGVTRPEDQTGAVSQSLPANFYSSIHQPPTPHIRPIVGDEKEIPELEMPEPSPSGVGILDKMTEKGSLSLKDTGGFIPLATMSMPVRSAEFSRLRPLSADNEDVEELRKSMGRILSIIDETTEVGKDETENQGDDFGADGAEDDDGIFGMDMDMDE